MGVYIPGGFATQGPAPDGFHVPLSSEWNSVKTIWTALGGWGSGGTDFGITLKLPFAGYRNYNGAAGYNVGTIGYYWSSTPYNDSEAYILSIRSSYILPQTNSSRSYGFSVRCFKNSPVTPTSYWTKLYGTSIEAGGIFCDSTSGLISLSSNGTDWITIADKNLGATQVWNDGDTLSEANCGKCFQRGNNYGFPRTGGVTTSSTQVDVTGYGPGNYYSSSTWITAAPWNSTANTNLRGGDDGNVPVMTELKNAYIGVPLKSYEEIVAMATSEGYPRTNTIAELNKYPIDYYNLLNDGGKLTNEYIIAFDRGDLNVYTNSRCNYITGITSGGYAIIDLYGAETSVSGYPSPITTHEFVTGMPDF